MNHEENTDTMSVLDTIIARIDSLRLKDARYYIVIDDGQFKRADMQVGDILEEYKTPERWPTERWGRYKNLTRHYGMAVAGGGREPRLVVCERIRLKEIDYETAIDIWEWQTATKNMKAAVSEIADAVDPEVQYQLVSIRRKDEIYVKENEWRILRQIKKLTEKKK